MQNYFRFIFCISFLIFSLLRSSSSETSALKSSSTLKTVIEKFKEKNKNDQKKIEEIKKAEEQVNKAVIKANLGKAPDELKIEKIGTDISKELEKKEIEKLNNQDDSIKNSNNSNDTKLEKAIIRNNNNNNNNNNNIIAPINSNFTETPAAPKASQNTFQKTLEALNKEEVLNKKKEPFLTPKEREKENLIIEAFKIELENPAANFGISYLENDENKAEIIKDYLKSPKIQKMLKNMPKEEQKNLIKKLKESFNAKVLNLKNGNWNNLKLKKTFDDNNKNNSFQTKKTKDKNYFSLNEINKEITEEKKLKKIDSLKNEDPASKILVKRKPNESKKPTKKKRLDNLMKNLSASEKKNLQEKLKKIEESLEKTLTEFEKNS